MNAIKAAWSERTNILSLLNTVAIVLVAHVLWVQLPHTPRNDSAEFSSQSESIDKLTERLDHPLTVQSESMDKLIEILNHPLSVTLSNKTHGLNGVLETDVPFKVEASVEGKLNTTVEGGSQFNPIHISNP